MRHGQGCTQIDNLGGGGGELFICSCSCQLSSKDLPNMNTFCDWLFETIVISAYDSFFRNYISIVLLSLLANHSACSYR